jgi:hypothetical protein
LLSVAKLRGDLDGAQKPFDRQYATRKSNA